MTPTDSNLSATSSLYLDREASAANAGRPVYRVCRIGTEVAVGRVKLGWDDRWRIEGAELDSWDLIADAVRMVMANA